MSVALHLYQQLRDAPDEDSRAKIIATAFEQLEDRYPNLKNVATHSDIRESELRLQKEIIEAEGRVRTEIKELEGRIQAEMKELEGRIQLQLKEMDRRISNVELKIAETKVELVRWVVMVGILQTTLITGVLLKIAHLI